jgi:hypothetical protein
MNSQDYVNQRISKGINVSIGQAISQGFSYMGKSAGSYIGYFFIMVILAIIGGAVVGAIFNFVDLGVLAGNIADIIVDVTLTPALGIGFAAYCHSKNREQFTEFGNFFDGFRKNYAQLVVLNLVIQLIFFLLAALLIFSYVSQFQSFGQDLLLDPGLADSVINEIASTFAENWWRFLIFFVLAIVIYILYSLSNFFVVLYGYNFWEAMEASRRLISKVFFTAFLFHIVAGLVFILGTAVTLIIGIIYFLPAYQLMLYSFFEQIADFDDLEPSLEDDLIIS